MPKHLKEHVNVEAFLVVAEGMVVVGVEGDKMRNSVLPPGQLFIVIVLFSQYLLSCFVLVLYFLFIL